MSGSSLDGTDIAYVQFDEVRGVWSYELLQADCIPYTEEWKTKLKHAAALPAKEYVLLHTAYGRYLGDLVNQFVLKHDLEHKVHFIASHGHTVFHEPALQTTAQIGDGATIAAVTGLPVISDLRAIDVALGGQGAPIVPMGDKLLFGEYDYLLNLGGIANLTIQPEGVSPIAFDVCTANQVLNALAQRDCKEMDEHGNMAADGKLLPDVLMALNAQSFFAQKPPRSLSNQLAIELVEPLLASTGIVADLLHTAVMHIVAQVSGAIEQYGYAKEGARMLVAGGGAFNSFLVAELSKSLAAKGITVEVPSEEVVVYKEALVMALLGALRWREEVNVLHSVTGASRDSVGGAIWLS